MATPHHQDSMPSRRKLILYVVWAGSAAALLAVLTSHSQPAYQGISLSQWVATYTKCKWERVNQGTGLAQQEAAADAIRQIGTNALPLLFDLIDHPAPGLWRKGRALSEHLLPETIRLTRLAHAMRQHHHPILDPRDAVSLSEALGPMAAPAIRGLIQRLSSTNWTGHSDLAKIALAYTGPEALARSAPSYIPQLLTDPDLRVRWAATNGLLKTRAEALTNTQTW